MKIGPNGFLRANLAARGASLRLNPASFRRIRIRRNASPLQWGLEYWPPRKNMAAPSTWIRVIAGVDYLLTTSLNGAGAGAALFQVDRQSSVTLFGVSAPVVVRPASPNSIEFVAQ